MRPVRPRSSSICLRSVSKLCASCPSMVTENSIPILRSEPPRNFGSTFVPSRFQISGGTSPEIRNVRLLAEAPAQAGTPAVGVGSGCGSGPRPGAGSPRPPAGVGSGPGTGSAPGSCTVFSKSAFDFKRRNTPDSKVTSSTPSGSLNHTRSYVPSGFWPEASPKSPLETNSTILPRSVVSGSSRRVSDPLRKLWRRLASGHAPDS